MSIVITGDTHGTFDIGKVVRYFNEHEDEYTQDDYLIICGDVGICGFSAAYEANTRAVFRSLPVTTLFIDGNHENFEQLNSYAVEQWNGGKVHIIEDNMIHLMRGQIFKIDGLKFFTFGGAYSIDKMSRAEGISWFPEEIPSREEYEEGWKNLEKEDFPTEEEQFQIYRQVAQTMAGKRVIRRDAAYCFSGNHQNQYEIPGMVFRTLS